MTHSRTSQVSYYDHPACSNSKLSALKKELSGVDQYDLGAAYMVGSLVDAMLTDKTAIDLILKTCNGKPYTDEQYRIAVRCRDAFMGSYICRSLLQGSELQAEFYSELAFDSPIAFTLPFKAKLDGLKRMIRMAWDLKSTAAKTLQEFRVYVERLDYDRAAAVYMKMADCDKFVILGVSKGRNPEIFPVTIERGDWLHQQGEEKLQRDAFQYYMLKYNV